MKRNLFTPGGKGHFTLIDLDKRAALSIQNHFGLSNYQMLVLSWAKGLWTGILISLCLHFIISH